MLLVIIISLNSLFGVHNNGIHHFQTHPTYSIVEFEGFWGGPFSRDGPDTILVVHRCRVEGVPFQSLSREPSPV